MNSYRPTPEEVDRLLEKKNYALAMPFYESGKAFGAFRVWRANSAFWNPSYCCYQIPNGPSRDDMHQDWDTWHGDKK